MSRVVAVVLSLLILTSPSRADAGDDQYQFLYGLQRKGMHELVVKEATSFLVDYPNHEKRNLARYRLASSLFELKDHRRAAKELQKLSKLSGFEFESEVWFRLGECHLILEKYQAAVQAFNRVLDGESNYLTLSAIFLAGEAHFGSGNFQKAEQSYTEVLKRDSNGEHARDAAYGLVWSSFRLGNFQATTEQAQNFLRRWRMDEVADEMRHLLGEAYMAQGESRQALAAFRSVEGGELKADALHGEGFALAALDDHEGAARSFAALVEEYPDSRFASEAALHLGIHLVEAEQFHNALVAFALPQVERGAEHFYWKSRADLALDDAESALQALEQAGRYEMDAELRERINVARGDVLFRLDRASEATVAYGESESEYALHAAAVASFESQRFAEAAKLASRQLQRYPEGDYASPSQLTLAEALFAQEKYEQAEPIFREFAAREGRQAKSNSEAGRQARASVEGALMRAGWCAYRTEQWMRAAETFAVVAAQSQVSRNQAEALHLEGRAREKAGDLSGAVRVLSNYLERHAGDTSVDSALMAMSRLKPGEAGIPFLSRLVESVEQSPERAAALAELGERYADLNQFEQSRSAYQQLRTEYPESELKSSAIYGEAWACYSLSDFNRSLALLENFEQLEPPTNELGLAGMELLVFAAERSDRADLAKQAWARFARHCRDDLRLLNCVRALAGVLDRTGERSEARRILSRVVARLQTPEAIASARIECLWLELTDGDLASAEANLIEALNLEVERAAVSEAAFFLGEARYESGENARAIELYQRAIGEESELADRALYKLGFARLRLGQNREAGQAFRALVELHSRSELFGESLFLLGESAFRDADFQSATEAYARVISEVPKHAVVPKALYRLGVAHCQLQNWKDGERALSELVRSHSEFEHVVEADLWRGRALAAMGSMRSAKQALQRVMARDEGVLAARARLELGRVALVEEDLEAALSEFLKVALLYASEEEVAEALLWSGKCLDLKGSAERAQAQYAELLEKYPQSSSAAEARERLVR